MAKLNLTKRMNLWQPRKRHLVLKYFYQLLKLRYKIIFNQICKWLKAERDNECFPSQWMTLPFIQFSPLPPPGIIRLSCWNKAFQKYSDSTKIGNDLIILKNAKWVELSQEETLLHKVTEETKFFLSSASP